MTPSSAAPAKKPLLFFTSFAGEGHTNPVLAIAASMVQRGYDVAYLCSTAFEDKIKDAGAEFFEIAWEHQFKSPEEAANVASMAIGLKRLAVQLVYVFYKGLSMRAKAVAETLERLRARDLDRQIICIEDILNMGTMPFRYGCPLPAGFDTPPKTIGISPVPLMVQSQDTGPFLLGLPPDSTESGRLRNKALNRLVNEGPLRPLIEAWEHALDACGCTVTPSGSPMTAWFTAHDASIMLCSPSLEYPVSDLPRAVQFAGCLPRGKVSSSFEYPVWWPEVTDNARGTASSKKIIFVSQGTVNKNWNELVLPTLQAFAGRDQLLVVAALGLRGAKLDDAVDVPANARVIDYLPYDVILPLAHVFISNAGYGAFRHAVVNGVATVFAGETEDKLEVAMRGEWAGFAHNLKTQTPSPEKLRIGVTKVLDDERYTTRAAELRRENEALDCLARIEKQVELFTE
ncbi:UDP-glucuronosyl/UDP-glucosyltransferase [Hirsutella rhossiliensis]|uniref:UDP-glucuronosyl/UDP-glucosyltransferase n=1 Tax=Hirsutella rhossiliensis TaxID=111463 RepID=A0A9P8MX76_9HYPO|nr:UDP-glucuronosyl/UDP-glucosyltransferase [Hirsutella rhossiliensis]KAH0962844.1 UDP-glucuronosyl/UDP-glucosyltransferase [Hirsutella rhossiliensis]